MVLPNRVAARPNRQPHLKRRTSSIWLQRHAQLNTSNQYHQESLKRPRKPRNQHHPRSFMPPNIIPSLAAGVVPTPQLYVPRGYLPIDPESIEDLLLVTCIRYDPVLLEDHDWHSTKSNGEQRSPYLILPFHLSRLKTAAEAFQWKAAIEIVSRPDALQALEGRCETALRDYNVPHWDTGDKSAYMVGFLFPYHLSGTLTLSSSCDVSSSQVVPSTSRSNRLVGDHSTSWEHLI